MAPVVSVLFHPGLIVERNGGGGKGRNIRKNVIGKREFVSLRSPAGMSGKQGGTLPVKHIRNKKKVSKKRCPTLGHLTERKNKKDHKVGLVRAKGENIVKGGSDREANQLCRQEVTKKNLRKTQQKKKERISSFTVFLSGDGLI